MNWNLEVVPISVTDVDEAKAFYVDRVGFHLDLDVQVDEGYRIVQLTPPGSASSIHLKVGEARLDGLLLVVDDVDAARSELAERGVDVSPVVHFEAGVQLEGRGGEWNSFAFFADPDGNAWGVQERPAAK